MSKFRFGSEIGRIGFCRRSHSTGDFLDGASDLVVPHDISMYMLMSMLVAPPNPGPSAWAIQFGRGFS
jgi:hypothetical protein